MASFFISVLKAMLVRAFKHGNKKSLEGLKKVLSPGWPYTGYVIRRPSKNTITPRISKEYGPWVQTGYFCNNPN